MPTLLYPADKQDRERIGALRHSGSIRIVDEIEDQLHELYAVRHPESIRSGVDEAARESFCDGIAGRPTLRHAFGAWVLYPWSQTLVHALPEPLHTELRTSRNRNLITRDEQKRYYGASIGVAGLSVGNSVVASIAHTGGAKYLRIADHDVLSGSNINRIRAGFDSVGLPKSTIVAREVYEVNPYADIAVYAEGITGDNIDRFLTYPKPLDLVIDEMDSLYLKIVLRLRARFFRIPVIMAADNGDGVVVDIERYDLHPRYPLMHGQVPENELLAITPDTPRPVAAKIISAWVQPDNIDGRMKDSLMELGKTLYTWPQLGNAAFMAGSVLSYVARRIVLKQPVVEGKVVLNPDAFFVPGFATAAEIKKRRKRTAEFVRALGL